MKYDMEGLLLEDLPIPLFSLAESKVGQLCLSVSLRLFGRCVHAECFTCSHTLECSGG